MGFEVQHAGDGTRDIYRRGRPVGRIRGRMIELHGFWSRAEVERAVTAVSAALDRWYSWQGNKSISRGRTMRKADIEVFADFTCPWCYITTRRMHAAIQQLPADVQVEVFWRPFPVDAPAVRSAINREGARHFLTAIGAAEGIEFAFDRMGSVPDTADAHRLVLLAAQDGQRADVVADLVDRIYRAHFNEGRDIGNRATLVELATEAGLDSTRIAGQLAGSDGILEVHALRRRANDLGIQAAPFLLINNIVGVRGSRSTASLRGKIEGGSWFGVDRRRQRAA